MVGERLKLLRKRKGLSQKELASAVGTSQGHISCIEKNEKTPGGELLISLKKFFGVNLDWLLAGEGEMDLTTATAIDEDPAIAELLEGARRVLRSGNPLVFHALAHDIHYFDQLAATEKRLEAMETKMAELTGRPRDRSS